MIFIQLFDVDVVQKFNLIIENPKICHRPIIDRFEIEF
jgi:hypothetical protein